MLWWIELGQDADLPASLSHYGLDQGGDFAESLQRFRLSGARPFMLIFGDGRIVFEDHAGNYVKGSCRCS